MKKLPALRRPYFAKTILEIGGGHAPYEGVTHAVDKFPENNSQRAGDLKVLKGVEFKEGDLEAIPFQLREKFDFLYASHVLEHVNNPAKAIAEINRVSTRGYIATPSPLREQIACPYPFDEASDFHTLYCWGSSQPNTIHVSKKVAARIGEFCDCEQGRLAKLLFELRRSSEPDLEALLPGVSKETSFYFHSPLQIVLHDSFPSACRSGACAFASAKLVTHWTSFPAYLASKRFRKLGSLIKKQRVQRPERR